MATTVKEVAETARHSSIIKATTEQLQETVIPDVFLKHPTSSSTEVCLQAYRISFNAIPVDREYASFVLLLQSPLPKEAANFLETLELRHGKAVLCKLEPAKSVFLDHFQVAQAEWFQSILFSVLLDRDLEHPKNREPPISDGSWYLLLPLKQTNPNKDPEIDWDRICKLKPFEDSNYTFGRTENACTKVDGAALHFSNGVIDMEDVPGLLVKTLHGKDLYCIIDMFTDMNAESRFPNPRYKSYVDYFKAKSGHDIVLKEQHLLKARILREAHNFLLSRSGEKDHGSNAAPENIKEAEKSSVEPEKSTVELPPEVCRIVFSGFYDDFVNAAVILPSLLHKLESILVATQLHEFLSSQFPEGSQVSIKKILEALTTEKCQDSFSLERLELLGDSFLKYAISRHLFLVHEEADEGFLSMQRIQKICNSSLFTLGSKIGLPGYIRDTLFDPKHWVAPCRPCKAMCDESILGDLHGDCSDSKEGKASVTCNKRHRWMQRKTVADVIEALIGAYLEDSGEHAALSFMGYIGLEVAIDISQVVRVQSSSANNLALITRLEIKAIEKLLSYSFRHKGLLVEAFTHASFTNHPGKCYQRLEFLGDSVLDFLITKHLYKEFQDSKPGELTDLRSTIVSNETFARIAIQHQLYLYLIEKSVELRKGINESISYVWASSEQEIIGDWKGDKCSKVLADILESLSGAICVDGDFDLSLVWEVFQPLLGPLISSRLVHLDPVRELQEVCQRNHLTLAKSSSSIAGRQCQYNYEIHVNTNVVNATAVSKDKKSAKRRAALDALEQLKVLGYVHSCKGETPDPHRTKKRDSTVAKKSLDKFKLSDTPQNTIPSVPLLPTAMNTEFSAITAGSITHHVRDCMGEKVHDVYGFSNKNKRQFGVGPFDTSAKEPSETTLGERNVNETQFRVSSFVTSAKKPSEDTPEDMIPSVPLSSTALSQDILATGAGSSSHHVQDQVANKSALMEKIKKTSLGVSNVKRPQFRVGTTREEKYAGSLMDHRPRNLICIEGNGKRLGHEIKDEQKSTHSELLLGTLNSRDTAFTSVTEEPGGHLQHLNMAKENLYSTPSVSAASKGYARASLHEACSRKRWKPPSFICCHEEGPPHDKRYTYDVILELPHVGQVECRGYPRKCSKAAMDSAAAELLAWLVFCGYL